jgi:hypothetical protein
MSRRVAPSGSPPHVEQLQKELGQLKEAAIAANVADNAAAAGAETAAPSFDSLSGAEKSAASLGIHPVRAPSLCCLLPPVLPTSTI